MPSVYIETENRRSITSKEQYINCTFIYVDGDSLGRYENTLIRGRGNSTWTTWGFAKKPYNITIYEDAGFQDSKKVEFVKGVLWA